MADNNSNNNNPFHALPPVMQPNFQLFALLDQVQYIMMTQNTMSQNPPSKRAIVALAAACEAITTFLLQTAIESQTRIFETRLSQHKSIEGLELQLTPHSIMIAMFQDNSMAPFFNRHKVVVSRSGTLGGILKCLIPSSSSSSNRNRNNSSSSSSSSSSSGHTTRKLSAPSSKSKHTKKK